jgi:hypothetical protein
MSTDRDERRRAMAKKEHEWETGSGGSDPEVVEVVFTTTGQFNLLDSDNVTELVNDIKTAIKTDFKKALSSKGTLRIRGAKRNC